MIIKSLSKLFLIFFVGVIALFIGAQKVDAAESKKFLTIIKPAYAQNPPAALGLHFTNQGSSTTTSVIWDIYRGSPGSGSWVNGTTTYVGAYNNVWWNGSDDPDAGGYYVIWEPVKSEGVAAGDVNCTDPMTTLENEVFNFSYSAELVFTCNVPTVSPPGAFNGLSASASCVSGTAQIAFSWGSSSGATSYSLYWSVGGNPRSTSAQVSTGGTSYTQSGFSQGVTVNWDVRAFNSGGSTWTSGGYYAVSTPSSCSPPGSFSGNTPTSSCSGGVSTVNFSWGSASNATSYNLHWEVGGNPRSTSADVTGIGSTSRSQGGFTPGVTINWDVQAVNGNGATWTSNGYYTYTVASCAVAPTVNILANGSNGPITVATGSTVTLSWTTTNSPTSCTASNSWSGSKATGGSSENRVVSVNSTFTLTCSNTAGSAADSVVVNVGSAPGVDLLVNGSNGPLTVASGTNVTLSWTTTNSPTSCTASNSWSGSKSTGGSSEVVTVFANSTYSLTCSNAIGSNSDSVTVNLGTPASVDILANSSNGPITVATGSNVTLSWTPSGAPSSCTASNAWSGSKSTSSSSQIVTVNANSIFTISCSNAYGSGSDSVTVNVSGSAPAVNLTANGSDGPISVATGSSITLAWTTTNSPTSCTASNAWSGSKAVGGGSQSVTVSASGTFSISCSNASGTGTDSVVVNVITTGDISIRVRAADLNGFVASQFVSGATVRLLDTANNPISTCTSPASCIATSDGNGWVSFTGVPAGQVRMASYLAGYDGRFKQTEGDCASATPGAVVSTLGPNGNTGNLLAALDDSFNVQAGVTNGCNDLGLVKKPNYTMTWNLPGGNLETNPTVGTNYSVSINPTNCTPGQAWPGTLTVNLTFAISPNDGNVSGLPAATPISLTCSGSQFLAFTLTPNSSVTRGTTYNITVTGNSSGITAPVPPSPIGVLGSQPVVLAGTLTISDGNWLQTKGGDFYSYGNINLSAAPPGTAKSSDFLVKTGVSSRGNAISSAPWYAEFYGAISVPVSYDILRSLQPANLTALPNCSARPTSSNLGAFICTGNVTVADSQGNFLAQSVDKLAQLGTVLKDKVVKNGKQLISWATGSLNVIRGVYAQEKKEKGDVLATVTLEPILDGYVVSQATTYATARSTGTYLSSGATVSGSQFGQAKCSTCTFYEVSEGFFAFDTSAIPTTATIDSVTFSLRYYNLPTPVAWTAEVRARDFGSTLEGADWVPGDSLAGYTLLATQATSSMNTSNYIAFTNNGSNFNSAINKGGITRFFVSSSRQRSNLAVTNGNNEYAYFLTQESAAGYHPTLQITYTAALPPNLYVNSLKMVPTASGCTAAGQTSFISGTTVTVCGAYGNNGSGASPSIWLSVYKNRATQPPINTVGDAADTNAGSYSAGFSAPATSNIATFVADSTICTTCTAGVFFDSRGNATETNETDNWAAINYTVAPPGPTVVTSPVTIKSASSATLPGTINPNGVSSTGWFRYSPTSPGVNCNDTFGIRVPTSGDSGPFTGSTAQGFSQPITGLLANTPYYYCAIGSNGSVISFGAVSTFTTDVISGPINQTVVFVDGDLTIGSNIVTVGTDQVIVYIVNGQVTINNNVTRVDAYIFADNGITTTNSSADACQLVINGGVAVGPGGSGALFNRNLNDTGACSPNLAATTSPAELINYDPRVIIALSNPNSPILGTNTVTFSETNP